MQLLSIQDKTTTALNLEAQKRTNLEGICILAHKKMTSFVSPKNYCALGIELGLG